MKERINNNNIKTDSPKVYVIQEIPGTKEGRPKINNIRSIGIWNF